jgi:phosphoserine aminotransferase
MADVVYASEGGLQTVLGPVASVALDAAVVHAAGNETIAGTKTFNSQIISPGFKQSGNIASFVSPNASNRFRISDTGISFYGATPVAQAAAVTAPNTQTGSYVQADVQSIVTAVNALITALHNLGLIG